MNGRTVPPCERHAGIASGQRRLRSAHESLFPWYTSRARFTSSNGDHLRPIALAWNQRLKRNMATNTTLSSQPPTHLPSGPSASPKLAGRSKRRNLSIAPSEFRVLLQSCIREKSLNRGVQVHNQIRDAGFGKNLDLLPYLLKLYAVCGRIGDARTLFDNIPTRNLNVYLWTVMINEYIESGLLDEAFALYYEMFECGVRADGFTYSTLLKACESSSLDLAKQLHSMVIKCGYGSFLSVVNSLIHIYSFYGYLELAQVLFSRMPCRDVVSWTSLIRACCRSKMYADALELFSRMQWTEGLKPNEVTLVSVLPACGFFSSLKRGQAVHAYVIRHGFSCNMIVASALVSMYAQCGHPDDAFFVFASFDKKNVMLWTSMIEGYSMNGRYKSALELFKLMQEKGLKPNNVTLVVILSACSHSGLIDDGWKFFNSMTKEYGIVPQAEHYACVVDMLGRAGQLDEAQKFIENMNLRPNASIFGSLLGACQKYNDVERGERLAAKLFELEPNNAANYIIISNIYAFYGRWDEAGRVRRLMAEKGLSKSPGCSWVEIKNKVYVFGAHDRSHPDSESIYKKMEDLEVQIVKAGYLPCTKSVRLDIDEEVKKRMLCGHSERLAIAFGLMKAPPGSTIRIAKNLRVCGDCHEATKLISKVTLRELVIRDTNRFHHFRLGFCSCGDYW